MLIMFYDTETTGLPDWKAPSEAEHQPHLVELAALLYDSDSAKMVAGVHTIVRPDGWEIQDEVAAIHGITTEFAARFGIEERSALMNLRHLHERADIRVAHNESFDARIIQIAAKRYAYHMLLDQWKDARAACTCIEATDIVALPPSARMVAKGMTAHKKPNLGECVQHFFGEELQGAHSAFEDARACARVYFAMHPATQS